MTMTPSINNAYRAIDTIDVMSIIFTIHYSYSGTSDKGLKFHCTPTIASKISPKTNALITKDKYVFSNPAIMAPLNEL